MAQHKVHGIRCEHHRPDPEPSQGSEDLHMVRLAEHDSRNVCGHYEAGDTGEVNLVFEDVRVIAVGNGNFKFTMLDLRYDRSIRIFWLSTVRQRTGGITPEHFAEYLKTTPDVVKCEIYPAFLVLKNQVVTRS